MTVLLSRMNLVFLCNDETANRRVEQTTHTSPRILSKLIDQIYHHKIHDQKERVIFLGSPGKENPPPRAEGGGRTPIHRYWKHMSQGQRLLKPFLMVDIYTELVLYVRTYISTKADDLNASAVRTFKGGCATRDLR
jgi:hypothetical protein